MIEAGHIQHEEVCYAAQTKQADRPGNRTTLLSTNLFGDGVNNILHLGREQHDCSLLADMPGSTGVFSCATGHIYNLLFQIGRVSNQQQLPIPAFAIFRRKSSPEHPTGCWDRPSSRIQNTGRACQLAPGWAY
jgi:hypothetical protein